MMSSNHQALPHYYVSTNFTDPNTYNINAHNRSHLENFYPSVMDDTTHKRLYPTIILFDEILQYPERRKKVEEIMKTRVHCDTNNGGEICVIRRCEYETDETISTLESQHEYHASCIKQWLLKGKRSCPICRSSISIS
ncbi:hypothetical protein RDI58_027029 [Solanum bulbocastanum]|uniref:RING-type E3 ubiquitin transferase n=1 Tax=Solanum bulbocastanum TaxID=147425 RepID=A0AAN8SUN3_SOLBU